MTAPVWPDSTPAGDESDPYAAVRSGPPEPVGESRPPGEGPTVDFRSPTGRSAAARGSSDPAVRSVAAAVGGVGRHWVPLAALGLLSIVVGLAILVWPQETVLVVAVLIAVELLVNGVVRLVHSFAADAGGAERVLLALVGILSILVGVLCLRNILQTVAALALLIGAFLLVTGVLDLIGGLSPGSVPGRAWWLLAGALGVIAGIAVLAYPGISLAALVALLGMWMLLYGAVLVAMAIAVRRESSERARPAARRRAAVPAEPST